VYEVNYGHIAGVTAPDGEDLDAYVLGIAGPVNSFEGIVVAIVHRHDDDDDKLIVLKEGAVISDGEIEDAVAFQEKWFLHKILRA
jgi:inorganic pyrophosphatase